MLESLRLYIIGKRTKWNHLPHKGGIYDQSPEWLDDFMTIRAIDDDETHKRQEAERRKAESGSKGRRRPRMR